MNPKETAVTNSKQDNLVQYPLPYKVVDGCLCQETTKRNKPTTEKYLYAQGCADLYRRLSSRYA